MDVNSEVKEAKKNIAYRLIELETLSNANQHDIKYLKEAIESLYLIITSLQSELASKTIIPENVVEVKAKKIEKFSDLVGSICTSVINTGDEIQFTLDNGDVHRLYHYQDCCESVYVEDVNGFLDDLIGVPILLAEESCSSETIDDAAGNSNIYDSHTWTFYKMATIKGYVTIRFLGTSNGYYSENVDFS